MKSSSYKYYTHLFNPIITINQFIVLASLYLFFGKTKKITSQFYNLKSNVAAKFIWQALNNALNLPNKFGSYVKRIHGQPTRHNSIFSALYKNKIKPHLQIPYLLPPPFSYTQTIYQEKATEVGINNYFQSRNLIGGDVPIFDFNLNDREDSRTTSGSHKDILYTNFQQTAYNQYCKKADTPSSLKKP